MSCFDCSSAVGRPAAFCRWSYLRCGSGRGGGQGEAEVGACESARAAERGRGEGEGEVEGGLAARHVGSGAARGHEGERAAHIIFSTVWRVSPSRSDSFEFSGSTFCVLISGSPLTTHFHHSIWLTWVRVGSGSGLGFGLRADDALVRFDPVRPW